MQKTNNLYINSASETESLKKVLPHGAISEIAKKSKKSIYTVSRVINGKSKNKKVVSALHKYLDELAANKKQIKIQVDFLAN